MNIKDRIKEKLQDKIIDWQERSSRRIYFTVAKENIVEVAQCLFGDLKLRLSTASGMETPDGFEILYHFSFDQGGEFYSVRTHIKEKNHPEIESITPLFAGAEWIEREMWEMLGINFKNHPNLKRLLLAEDWPEGNYPLRKNP